MRKQGAAPVSQTGRGRIDKGDARRIARLRGIAGLFWLQPKIWQDARIRELALTFSPETIATLTGRSFRDVLAVIEGWQ